MTPEVVNHHLRAELGEQEGFFTADPAPGAGDYRDFAI
jgi:hypothetical protein